MRCFVGLCTRFHKSGKLATVTIWMSFSRRYLLVLLKRQSFSLHSLWHAYTEHFNVYAYANSVNGLNMWEYDLELDWFWIYVSN